MKNPKINEMRADLADMEESLSSGALPDEMKKPVREGIKKLKADIAKLEKQQAEAASKAKEQEKAAEAEKEKAAQKAEAEKQKAIEAAAAKADADAKEAAAILAKRKKGKVTAENASDCAELIANVRKDLAAFTAAQNPQSKKPRRKKASATVALGIVKPIQSIARREMTAEKVQHIKLDPLREARGHFEKGLQQIKLAFGGIQDSNSTILKRFKKDFNALIKEIEERQKEQQKKSA